MEQLTEQQIRATNAMLEQQFPELWRACYPRIYTEPKCGQYYSPKQVARQLVGVALKVRLGYIGECEKYEFQVASHLVRNAVPMFWLSQDMATAIRQTRPPGNIPWYDMHLPFEACAFMLPKGALVHPTEGDISFVAYARFKAGELNNSLLVPGHPYSSINGGMVLIALSEQGGHLFHWNIPLDAYGPSISIPDIEDLSSRYTSADVHATGFTLMPPASVMDRQLKQTALPCRLSGEHFRRHYLALCYQRPRADVDSSVVIRVRGVAAGDAEKGGLIVPVLLVDAPTRRALTRRVPGINEDDGNASALGLVTNKIAKLGEPPVTQSRALVAAGRNPLANPLEFFKGDPPRGAFSIHHDSLGNTVVLVLLEPGLPSCQLAQTALGTLGSKLLQTGPAFLLTAADSFYIGTGVGCAVAIESKVDDAEIDAEPVFSLKSFSLGNVACYSQHPLTANKTQVYLTFAVSHQPLLVFTHHNRDHHAAFYGPQANSIILGETENTVIVGLGSSSSKDRGSLAVDLKGIGYLGDRSDSSLCGQAEAFPDSCVPQLVQVVLPKCLVLKAARRKPRARSVAALQCSHQASSLINRRNQLDGSDQLHRSGTLLRFDIAFNDAFRRGTDRTGIVTPAPQCRKARAERSKLLPQDAAASSLEAIDDFSDRQGGIGFDEQMHVVSHHFQRMDNHAMFGSGFSNQLLEPLVNGRDQNLATVFGAPYEVVFQAEHRSCISSVSRFSSHVTDYMPARYIPSSPSRRARPAIPLPAKAGSFSRRFV